jgi:hypothetical protein
MRWADKFFENVFGDAGSEDRSYAWQEFEAARAVALGLEDEGVFTTSQRNTFVRNWVENQGRRGETTRRALVHLGGKKAPKAHYHPTAVKAFGRSKYSRALGELYLRKEIDGQEVKALVSLWWTVFGQEIERGGVGEGEYC